MPNICQHCGTELPEEGDSPGAGLCDSCLWAELAASGTAESLLRDLVEGYTILEKLGRGGMGVVYRARSHFPGREVALKMLPPLDAGDTELRQRFRLEASALAGMDHPSILPLYEVGESEGLPYFTMKLASGGTLAEKLKADGSWPAMRAAGLMALIAEGVQFAHSRGIIHRDIKPANILFDDAGRPYLADFGLAKLTGGVSGFTRSGGVMGTPAYLAPEIAAHGARAATTASDLYGLGAVLYELLTGRPPFAGHGMAALLLQITGQEPEAPSTWNSQVPRDLEIICLKCLSKEPAGRYLTAREFAGDLGRWMRGEPIMARRITLLRRLVKWARRRPALAALSAALIILTAASGLWLAVTNRQLKAALLTVREERERADRRADFFIGSFADSLDGVGRFDLLNVALRDVLDTETGSGAEAGRRRASVMTRLGYALRYQGQMEESLQMLQSALREARCLEPSGMRTLLAARACAELALTRAEADPAGGEVQELKELRLELGSGMEAETDIVLEARSLVAEALGVIALENGETPELLLEYVREASALRRRRLESGAGDTGRIYALAGALAQESDAQVVVAARWNLENRQAEAEALMESAAVAHQETVALAEWLCAKNHPAAAWQRLRAARLMSGVSFLPEDSLPGSAVAGERQLAHLEESGRILRELSAADPLDWRSRQFAAAAHRHLADFYEAAGDMTNCRAQLTAHLEVARELSRRQPDIRQCTLGRIDANMKLVRFCVPLPGAGGHGRRLREEDRVPADDWLRDALAAAEPLLRKRAWFIPDQRGYRQLCATVIRFRLAMGDLAGAREVIHHAADLFSALPVTDLPRRSAAWNAAALRLLMADQGLCRACPEEAVRSLTEALEVISPALAEGEEAVQAEIGSVRTALKALCTCLSQAGRHEEALVRVENALNLWRALGARAGDAGSWLDIMGEPLCQAMVEAGGPLKNRARHLAERVVAEFSHGLAGREPAAGLLEEKLEKLRTAAADAAN